MRLCLDLIILDFDGVVIDSAGDISTAVNHTRGLFSLPALSPPTIISYIGDGVKALIERSFEGSPAETKAQAMTLYREYYRTHLLDETRLYPHVEDTLKTLHELGKIIALVTNKSESLAELILTGLGVRTYFDLIIGPESVTLMKPNPQGIIKVLETFRIPARGAIMVGDTHTDIEAGRRAGTWTGAARYGLGDKETLIGSQPDIIIDDISELLQYLA